MAFWRDVFTPLPRSAQGPALVMVLVARVIIAMAALLVLSIGGCTWQMINN